MSTPRHADAVRRIAEVPHPGDVPAVVHPEWRTRHPWLVQGTTTRGAGEPFDLALFGPAPAGPVHRRWVALRTATGCDAAVHARQVHGAAVRVHRDGAPGLYLAPPCDGHLTRRPGVLVAVTVADCVPVTVVHPRLRVVAALHAGWRGVAAGVLEAGLAAFRRAFGIGCGEVEIHLGPAICGECYEVGPEVHRALGLPEPHRNTPVDVRAVLGRRCVDAGVPAAAVTSSRWCTRCGLDGATSAADAPRFFSHRGGDAERQVGFVGVRPT
jgi:hypothetical protein